MQVLFCLLFTGSLFWTRRGEILQEVRSDMILNVVRRPFRGKVCMIRMICLELARLDYGEEKYNSTIILIIHTNMQWFYMLSVDILKRIM